MKKPIITSIVATVILLIFFYAQGAIVIVNNITGTASALIRGAVIWAAVITALVVFLIKDKSLRTLSFVGMEKGSARSLCYFFPMIVVAVVVFAGGLGVAAEGAVAANLFLTLGIGFAEEIYFRGIICKVWSERNTKAAIIVSSVLFALCHLLNVMGGAGIGTTILQICFALVYGVAQAFVFLKTKSIWPCILLHAFHDFCSFITLDGSVTLQIVTGAIQFVILLAYVIYLIMKNRKVSE